MDPFALLLVVIMMLTGCTDFNPLLLRYENLPICDMREPIHARCREVKGVWGGTRDGVIRPHYHPRDGRTP